MKLRDFVRVTTATDKVRRLRWFPWQQKLTARESEVAPRLSNLLYTFTPEWYLAHDCNLKSLDMWSCGITLYELIETWNPFVTEAEIASDGIFFKRSLGKVSQECFNFIRWLLDKDPKERLTKQQVLEHPWFNNVRSQKNVCPVRYL